MIKRFWKWLRSPFEYTVVETVATRQEVMKTVELFVQEKESRGMETETLIMEHTDPTKKIPLCTCSSCTQGAELPPAQQGLHEKGVNPSFTNFNAEETPAQPSAPTFEELGDVVREGLQGLHEVEIDTESDFGGGLLNSDDRVSVSVSILIPPSSNHPLYNRYAYEFEKSMWLLVTKCLELSEKFKRDDLDIGAFNIEATLSLRGANEINDDGEHHGFPHNYPDPSAGNSGLFTDDPEPGNRRPHWLNEALKPLDEE